MQLLEQNAERLYERVNAFGAALVDGYPNPKHAETAFQVEQRCAQVFLVETLEWGVDISQHHPQIVARCSQPSHHLLIVGADLLYCVDVVVPLFTTVAQLLQVATKSRHEEARENAPEVAQSLASPPTPPLFVLTSSFHVGADINAAVNDAMKVLNLQISEMQALDVASGVSRVQYCSRLS